MKKSKMVSIVLLSFFIMAASFNVYAADSYTKTKYPLVLVPGVLGFDKVLVFLEYFYGIKDALNNDNVHLISLSGWQSTEERGLDLKNKVEALCAKYGYEKVNLIAHSHGSTTSRVAMKLIPNRIASLTTIAGPHYGTPTADCALELPGVLQSAGYGLINLVAGDMVGLLSGHLEYVGNQNTQQVVSDFTKDNIKKFNEKYPCAGVPKGGAYGKVSSTLGYGSGAPREGSYTGDAFGNAGSIRFYSWTGNIGHDGGTRSWYQIIPDPVDIIMAVINLINEGYGYKGNADCFIPVTSAHFGQVIGDTYYWNHADEINQTMGLLGASVADPKQVFRQHANRLKLAGL